MERVAESEKIYKLTKMWEMCSEFMKTEEAKKHLKESVITPMTDIIYNEFYFYLWFICVYHVLLIFIILLNLALLLRLGKHILPKHI